MFPVLNIGPLSLPLPELILLIGFWLGSFLSVKMNISKLSKPDVLENILWTCLILGLIGGRISFFARYPGNFSGDYISILSINPHLFDLSGGVIISIATAIILISRNDLSILETLDGFTPFFSIFLIFNHLSGFSSGSRFGIKTELPWGIFLWGETRHPVQLYYAAGGFAVFLFLLYFSNKYRYTQGVIFSWYSFLTSSYLLVFSSFQAPGFIILGAYRLNQIIFWLFTVASFLFINYFRYSHQIQE
jgi:phosphatidylglycerol:prolipoprotein diacylglycerol transferase